MSGTRQVIARNKKASYNYFLEGHLEAGIVLNGSEVKALRNHKGNIEDSYGYDKDGELFLYNSHIGQYDKANQFNHEPRRARKLLCHKAEIKKIMGKIHTKGYTLVPVSIYFDNKNRVKVELALGKGKKLYDKREDIAKRDANRRERRERI